MEAKLRTKLESTPLGADDSLVSYVVDFASATLAEDDSTIPLAERLADALSTLLVEYGACPDVASAVKLLKEVAPEEESTPTASTSSTPAPFAPVPSAAIPASAPAEIEDFWGTKSVPIQNETNTLVERIESAQERGRRERKENKAAKAAARALDAELEQIQKESSAGVASQVTASARNVSESAKRSNGDINVQQVTISVGASGRELLSNATVRLSRGLRYGLVGRNGVGKSTLLTHIARRDVAIPPDVSILYVAQEMSGTSTSAVECVMKGDPDLAHLLQQEKEAMARGDAAALQDIQSQLQAIDADSAEPRARQVLHGLGFTKEMQDAPTNTLSGGWRMRAALAAALFSSPDLLLLDEPTNGLSLAAVIWLENYLTHHLRPNTTLVVVSHDRVFLNAVVNCVVLLEQQQLQYYKGDIDSFEKIRAQKHLQQTREREAQLGKIEHMQKFVDRFRYNAKRASLAQSRIKAITRMESTLADELFSEPEMSFEFPEPDETETREGQVLVQADGVGFAYPLPDSAIAAGATLEDRLLFRDVDLSITAGSKMVLLGENGFGKSTFLKILMGDLTPTHGSVTRKSNVRIATFAQHHVDQLDLVATPLEFMLNKFPGTTAVDMRPHLARFGITAELANQRIASMSGGQKSRLAFALVTWKRPHVLLLDEPSSHLDLETCDALLVACAMFSGAIFVISHDQNLIQTLPDEIWHVERRRITRWKGEFAEYKKKVLLGDKRR